MYSQGMAHIEQSARMELIDTIHLLFMSRRSRLSIFLYFILSYIVLCYHRCFCASSFCMSFIFPCGLQ